MPPQLLLSGMEFQVLLLLGISEKIQRNPY